MTALKWEPRDNRAGEWRAYVGKLRLREWPKCRACAPSACKCRTYEFPSWRLIPGAWQRYEWSIEGHQCRVLASGGAPTRKAARAMAEAAAKAANEEGLR